MRSLRVGLPGGYLVSAVIPRDGIAGHPLNVERQMRELTVKTKFLYVLPEPFSLTIPYTDRQRLVVAADEQVTAERRSRSQPAVQGEARAHAASADDADEPVAKSHAAVAARHLQRGLQGLQGAGTDLKRGLDDRAQLALRRRLGILMIGRTEAGVLRFDHGHPLADVLYVGHPARPDLYYPAAEFHRRVFEHKFAEAVKLLTSLGASRIALTQIQGQGRTRETEAGGQAGFGRALGFARTRDEQSWSGAQFVAEFPGSGKPAVPDDLCWYPDEHTWQLIAHTRITGGAEKTSLEVRYMTDYGIDTQMVRAARTFGVKIGGKFQEHHDTIWRLDAEFPSLAT